MTPARKIAVVTGTRADYGLLRGLLTILRADASIELQLIASGAHLIQGFGNTIDYIERDGFSIASRVALELPDDSPLSIARAVGAATSGIAEALAKLKPNILVLIGDRYEMLAAGNAALLLNIPAAHIHGGEITFGAFDDSIRHALTKLSALHFVAAEPYRRRVIQMGEDPSRVFCVGAPGLDQFAQVRKLSREETTAKLGIPPNARYLLITLHPTTAQPASDIPATDALLSALGEMKNVSLIFTGVNADPGHAAIDNRIRAFVEARPVIARLFTSLGSESYINALTFADAVVGNSSSGIVEAPAAGVPTVNIGDRQTGRLRAASVIDCAPERSEILSALQTALSAEFRRTLKDAVPPYGRSGASAKIARILKESDPASLLPKRFHDLN